MILYQNTPVSDLTDDDLLVLFTKLKDMRDAFMYRLSQEKDRPRLSRPDQDSRRTNPSTVFTDLEKSVIDECEKRKLHTMTGLHL